MAESLLRGGIAQFVGTYWPVHDSRASDFAKEFYSELAAGRTVRECVLSGRRVIAKARGARKDLANYMHYGDPAFVVKERIHS